MPQNWDARRVATEADRCPECGGKVAGGRGGCQELFDEIGFMMGGDLRIAAVHRLALDSYCMQHVESYCASAKSYAAHLVGLSWGIAHVDDPAPVAPVLRVLNRSAPLIKPPVLTDRGSTHFSRRHGGLSHQRRRRRSGQPHSGVGAGRLGRLRQPAQHRPSLAGELTSTRRSAPTPPAKTFRRIPLSAGLQYGSSDKEQLCGGGSFWR